MRLENVKLIIESGQFFRSQKTESGYFIQLRDKVFFLFFDGSFEGISEIELKNLFQLKITPKEEHIRIIKQDSWECIISFVCSSASNIPKIRKNIYELSKEFGTKIFFKKNVFYTFPEINAINDLEKIKMCGLGFRSKYVYEINKIITTDWIKKLESLSYEDAKLFLMTLPGVGDKIADCVCLFSLKHHQAFPIDVWIKRVLEDLQLKGNYKELSQQAIKKFGPHAGWVQQFLFYEKRTNKE